MANVFDRLDRIEKNQTQGKKDKRSALDRLDKIQPVKDTAKKVDADSLSRAKTTPRKQSKTDTAARGSKRKSFFSYDHEATSGYGQANRSPMGDVPRNAVRAEKKTEDQNGEKFSVGKLAGGMAVKGATDFAKSISGTLSFLEGAVTKPLDQLMGAEGEFVESGMFHKLNEDIKAEQEAAREYFQPNVERGGKAAEIADFLGTTTISAIPQGLMATVAGSTKAAQTGVDVVAKAKDLAPGIWNSVRSLAARSAKDPAFWSSFFQTIGNDYEEAIADGASELKAVSYAIGNGLLNAQVEVGGGLETMDEAGDMGIKAWAKAAKEEGNEEVIQGIIQRGLQNLVYEKGNPIASVSDENAVLNPMTSAQEWAGGAFAGGVLSGARIGGNYLAGLAYNRQLANIGSDYQVEPEALVQEGLSFPQGTEARRTAEQMQEKINSGTALTDTDLGKMVAANEQTMYQQRQLEWANTPAEERAADGDRALLETARKMVQGRENGKDPLTEALSGGKRVNQEKLTQEQMEAWDTHNDVWVDAKDNVYQMDPTQHISQRTFEGVGDRKVNAFQFDHPELQSYYKQAAEQLVRDASLSIDAPKTTRVERGTQGKRYIHEILDTPSLRSAMDMGLSRNQVIQAAQDLIANKGQENNAAAKRLEFVLDDMLTRGYTTAEGESFGPNAAYISAKETIPGYQAEQREALPIWDMEETAQTETAREQDVQQRMERVRRAAGALGESGGKALTAAYTEDTAKTIAPKEAVEGFYRVYNAAMKGEQLTGEGAQAAQKLPAHLRYAAQSAGQQDALRAKQAQFFGEKAGLVKDDSWKKAHLSSKTNRTLDALGKALGVQIKFAETVADGQANAQYGNGVITLALDANDPVLTTVTHETVHRLREMSPEDYSALADFVRGNLSEETTDFSLQFRERLYQSDDVNAMTEEMVADAFGRVLNDGKAIERLVQDNRSLAEKVRDVLADIVNAVKRVLNHQNLELTAEQKAEFRELEGRMSEMERLFGDALGKAEAQNGGKNTAQDGGTAKFSIKEDSNGKVVSDNRGWHWDDLSYRSYRGDSPMSRAGYAMMADDPHALHAYGDKVVAVRQAELKPIAEFQDKIAENWERDKENGTLPYALETELGHLSGEEVAAAFDPDDIVDSADAWDNEDMVQWAYEKVFDGITGVKTSDGAIVFDEGLLHSIDPEADVLGDELHGETRKESGKKYSLKEYTAEEKKQHVKDAVAYFGRTFKWAETGYITTDGKRLDFSGRHEGGPGGYRTVDHRDIRDALGDDYGGDDYSGSMVQFMGEGNIRISPESGGINMSVMPTKAQMDTLSDFISKQRGEVILDLDTPGGDTVSSTEYPRGTHANKVLGDIKAYFEEGKQPQVSEVAKFLYSKKEKNSAQDIAAMQEENRLLREQLGDYIRLQKQNETLRESREYWKGQTRRTERVTTDKKAVGKAAKELVQSYGAEVSTQQVQDKLQKLYDYMASGYDGKDELTFTEAWRRAKDIARDLVENAAAQDDELYRQYSDLRQYMKGTALVVTDQVKGDITDYGDFRKRNMGRMRLVNGTETNIDQVYKELSERWPEFFDENMQVTPTDQLLQISQVLNEVGTVETYNPFSADMQEAVAGAANEIMETFFDLPQTKNTFADRQALKLEEAKGKGRQQVQKVREDYNRRLDQLREQNRERVQRVIAKERENRAKKIDELKEHYKAKDAAGRERQTARELRAKITRHAGDLSQKLLRPSDKQHIPEEMRGAVAAMLESINQESQYTLDENGKRVKNGGGTPTKRTEAFRVLKEQYAKIVAEGGDLVIDPSLLGSDADGIKGGFDAVIAMRDIKLADMSVSQLQTVWQVVKAVEHSVNTAGKVLSAGKYKRTADWAQALSVETSSRRSKNSLTRSHASIDLETPYTFFSHYGQAGKDVYRMLRNAQDREQLMVNHVAEEVQKVVDPKTVKELEETTRTYTTERGEKLTLSTAQVMELHELMKRKQAHDHLLKGGIVQPEIKSAKIRRGTDSIRLTDTDLANIIGTLTAEEVKIADGLQALTTGVLADYGNQASMEAYGYKKFTERDYWPIKSAREGLHSDVEKGGSNTRSIKNIGMAKTTMPHASNALDIGGIFTTFANHAADMTDYAAWLCTMEDVNRLYNFKFRDEEGIPTGKTIKGVLDRVGGQGSQKYWHNLMEDIQNGINAPGDSPMWDIAGRTIGGFKGAAVGANMRVVIQQPTAFFRAAAVLDPGDMAKGLTRGVTKGDGWKKALEYSPIAMRKDAGGFDIASPRKMTETLFDNRTVVRKMNDALSAPAGKADAVTWGKLWNACEWATARDHQSLTKGSEAFYQQTAKLFAEVIDQTQVVDGVLQRSNIMRSSNAVVKQATSFMGEPIMSLNLLMRTWDQYRYEQNPAKRSRAKKTMGRAATALVVTNVVNALAQSLIDAMRDDDEDKKYWERFRTAFTGVSGDEESAWQKAWNAVMEGNVGSNMNPLGQIPFVKDALSIMQGYDVSRTEMEIVTDLIQAGQTAMQSVGGDGKKTRAYAIKGLLAAGAKMFGIPAANLSRDIWGLMRSAAVETGNIPLQYEMEKAIYNITNSSNSGRYLDIMYRALEQGDMDSYQHIREELSDRMGKSFTEMDSAMKSRYEKAKDKAGAYTLPQGSLDLIGIRERNETEKDKGFTADDLTAAQYQKYTQRKADTYRKAIDKGRSAKGYDTLDEEKRNTFEGAVNTYAKETSLEAESGGKYEITNERVKKVQEAEQKYGISPGEYLLIQTRASDIESLKDRDGETISNSKGLQIMELVYGYTGLSDKQKEAMFEYLGVGKTIRHYNPGKVKQELEKMKKK